MLININIFVANFILCILFILLGRKLSLKFIKKGKFVLEKDGRKVVKLGGIVLWCSLTLMGLVFLRGFLFPNSLVFVMYLSSALIFILGLLDDCLELKVWQKFLGELVITVFFVLASGMTTEIVFFPRFLNFVVTLIWILGITNAFNLLDIQDGLATGVGFIISLVFIYLSYITGNSLSGVFSLLLASSLLAVLVFNFPPARIYLGDAGSLFLGFIFSILAISISYAKSAHEMAILSPVFILGFPIFDTIFVSTMRIFKKKPIFQKTDDHFVLRLIARGKKRIHALFICYFITLVFIGIGVSFTKLSNTSSVILVFITLIFLTVLSFKINKLKA